VTLTSLGRDARRSLVGQGVERQAQAMAEEEISFLKFKNSVQLTAE
jgi:hypothetical protein